MTKKVKLTPRISDYVGTALFPMFQAFKDANIPYVSKIKIWTNILLIGLYAIAGADIHKSAPSTENGTIYQNERRIRPIEDTLEQTLSKWGFEESSRIVPKGIAMSTPVGVIDLIISPGTRTHSRRSNVAEIINTEKEKPIYGQPVPQYTNLRGL